LGLSLSSTETLLSSPAGFTDTRVISAAVTVRLWHSICHRADTGSSLQPMRAARSCLPMHVGCLTSRILRVGPEIYVRRYPTLDRQWQVSDGGGIQARWSRNNREIYNRSGRHFVAATLDTSGPEQAFGTPVALLADDYDFGAGASIANYDITADGRFIMIRRGVNGGKLRVVINWTDELQQIPASGGAH
jgi:hypothetical protein